MAIRLPGKSTVVEEGLLLRAGGAAQHRIAVREAAEAADDLGVLLGVFEEFVIAISARQFDAALLIRQMLRMHERQIEKLALAVRDLAVEPAGDRTAGNGTRERIGQIGARVAAEHVAGKLVEHDGERQRALWRVLPSCELAAGSRRPQRREAP